MPPCLRGYKTKSRWQPKKLRASVSKKNTMTTPPFQLSGQTIIITGASSGIGRQCAISCSQQGANLVLMGRRIEALAETAALCRATTILTLVADMEDAAALEEAVMEAVKTIGRINGVIHCAGISTTLPLRMIRPEKLEQFMRINLIGALELTRLVCKPAHFARGGGSIVFLASVMGVVGEQGKTMYSATKGGLIAAAKSLALELARRQIRVNCVSPGVVVTPMTDAAAYNRDEASLAAVTSLHPLGLGDVKDVANSCVFLLSDAARWITGINLCVDGGYTAH